MKRRSFLGSLVALAAAPALAKLPIEDRKITQVVVGGGVKETGVRAAPFAEEGWFVDLEGTIPAQLGDKVALWRGGCVFDGVSVPLIQPYESKRPTLTLNPEGLKGVEFKADQQAFLRTDPAYDDLLNPFRSKANTMKYSPSYENAFFNPEMNRKREAFLANMKAAFS